MFEKRKVEINSKLVGISEAIRLILIFFNLHTSAQAYVGLNLSSAQEYTQPLIYQGKYSQYTMHETPKLKLSPFYTRANVVRSENKPTLNRDSFKFNEWLAGLIDGDGYFILTKKGYASCEITMDVRDKKALYEIKHKYGGSIKAVAGNKALRYKLRNKKGLVYLINHINGLIRNPTRLLQINKLCSKYGIDLIYPKALTYNNG
jgi:LAGLIDADG DNA endonuclease family protein